MPFGLPPMSPMLLVHMLAGSNDVRYAPLKMKLLPVQDGASTVTVIHTVPDVLFT